MPEITFVGKHTKRCPRCKSEELLKDAIMTLPSGERFEIKTCSTCGAEYRVIDTKGGK